MKADIAFSICSWSVSSNFCVRGCFKKWGFFLTLCLAEQAHLIQYLPDKQCVPQHNPLQTSSSLPQSSFFLQDINNLLSSYAAWWTLSSLSKACCPRQGYDLDDTGACYKQGICPDCLPEVTLCLILCRNKGYTFLPKKFMHKNPFFPLKPSILSLTPLILVFGTDFSRSETRPAYEPGTPESERGHSHIVSHGHNPFPSEQIGFCSKPAFLESFHQGASDLQKAKERRLMPLAFLLCKHPPISTISTHLRTFPEEPSLASTTVPSNACSQGEFPGPNYTHRHFASFLASNFTMGELCQDFCLYKPYSRWCRI